MVVVKVSVIEKIYSWDLLWNIWCKFQIIILEMKPRDTLCILFSGKFQEGDCEFIKIEILCSIINNRQIRERAQMSTDWLMDKEDVVYLYILCTHTHTHTHTHTMEYYSANKKNELLSFTMTWMELKYVMLSEISLRKTNTIWFHSQVEFKKQNRWT